MTYYVTIQNASDHDYVMTPCPDYIEFLGAKSPLAQYQLNCSPTGHIAPGKSVTFQMKFDVPRDAHAGEMTLAWVLIDGRIAPSMVQAQIEIT